MCYNCFHTLINELLLLSGKQLPNKEYDELIDVPASTECPLFVTWEKKKQSASASSDDDYVLRGCIGTLSPRPLVSATIQSYALTSALHDRRFEPVAANELSSLRVGVSLLVHYEVCKDVYDWEVGVHGILIRFHGVSGNSSGSSSSSTEYSATYLPEVAKEQG